MRTTALIPVLRGERTDFRLPPGMPYTVLEHDRGERAEAISAGARQAETEFVFVVESDAGLTPYSLREMEMVCWDSPAVYPSLVFCHMRTFKPKRYGTAQPYCPHRLLKENYVGPTALIRRDELMKVGWRTAWETWLGLPKMKDAPQAQYLLRTAPLGDKEPVIERPRFLAAFYCQGTPSTAYVRCQLPAKHLPGYVQQYWPVQKRIRERDAKGRLRGVDVVFPRHEGAAVFQYPGDKVRALLMAYMQEQGFRVLVEVDDNYLAMDSGWAKKAGWTRSGDGVHSVERHRKIAASADGIIVTTEHLARAYRKVNPNVYVCRNSIEPDDWYPKAPDDGALRIGWFASMSHRSDGGLVGSALEWAGKQDGVEVVLMGVGADRTVHVKEDGETEKITGEVWQELRKVLFSHIPPTNDLGAYRKHMGCLDVGLAPVRRSISSDARSDLKAIEYAAAGAIPVLSTVPPYDKWTDGEHCRKASTRQEFLNIVKHLVRNRDETKLLAREAHEYVIRERCIAREAEAWREAVSP